MAKLKLIWTKTAFEQRNYILKFWIKKNGDNTYSKKIKTKIDTILENLKQYPLMGKLTDFTNTRTITFDNYSLFYEKKSEQIMSPL